MAQLKNTGTNKEKNQCNGTIWVQCENPMCMKWRKIPKDFCEDYSEISWFCHMNPDVKYNNCEVEQEKMQVPKGETIVFSELAVGSLVWAKMAGYPRWPGIITPDPCYEEYTYILRYEDGTNDPKYYHVEFLGEPRSHAWVSAKFVELYNTAVVDLVFLEKSMKGKLSKASFQKSLAQAADLFTLRVDERLGRCVYKFVEFNQRNSLKASGTRSKDCALFLQGKRKHANKDEDYKKKDVIRKNLHSDRKEEMFVNINGNVYPVYTSERSSVHPGPCRQENSEKPLRRTAGVEEKLCGVVNPIMRQTVARREGDVLIKGDVCKKNTGLKNRRNGNVSISDRKTFQRLVNNKKDLNRECKTELMDKATEATKIHPSYEIKTAINDEEAFWMEYNTFCKRHNIHTEVNHLTWYNKTVDFFTFFKKVQFMGGYRQAVSHLKIWRSICWDVLNVQNDSPFLSLRKAYRRVLLPFENYLKDGINKSTKKQKLTSRSPTMCLPQHCSSKITSIPSDSSSLLSPPRCQNASIESLSFQSPVFQPVTSTAKKHIDQVVPQLTTVGKSKSANEVLQGVLPIVPVKLTGGILILHFASQNLQSLKCLPSSNPSSPYNVLSPAGKTLSEVSLEVTLNELDDLERELRGIVDQSQTPSQKSTLLDESLPMFSDSDENNYLPIVGSQNVEDFNVVLGELTDLEDTLLEMAGEILSGTSEIS